MTYDARYFGGNLFDNFFGRDFDPFPVLPGSNPLYGKHAKNLMKTDVDLKDGYLSISAAKGPDRDEADQKGRYIRRERHAGTCSRSFYVGEGVEPADASAKFEDGILRLSLSRRELKLLSKSATIAIE